MQRERWREGRKVGWISGSERVGREAVTNGKVRPLFRKKRRLWNDITQGSCASRRMRVGGVDGMQPWGGKKRDCGGGRRASSMSTCRLREGVVLPPKAAFGKN